MPSQYLPGRTRSNSILALLVLSCVVGLAMSRTSTAADPTVGIVGGQTSGNGTLAIGGLTYSFETETCAIGETEFVMTGFGQLDDDHFRVRASIGSIDLALGTVQELERPSSESTWLNSVDPPIWGSDNNRVSASAHLVDPRDPDSPALPADLVLTCSSSTS